MASADSTNSPGLVVGSLVSFTSKKTGEFYQGTVYFFDADDSSFGIDDVSRTKVSGGYNRVEGCYQISLKDIKDLRVIFLPAPNSTTTNTKPSPGSDDASSSSASSPPSK